MCVCQEVLGEDVADTWEGSGILFKTKATVTTATREMALQQLQTAIELARRSGIDADEASPQLVYARSAARMRPVDWMPCGSRIKSR